MDSLGCLRNVMTTIRAEGNWKPEQRKRSNVYMESANVYRHWSSVRCAR